MPRRAGHSSAKLLCAAPLLLVGASSVGRQPCPVDSEAKYKSIVSLYALAPDTSTSLFHPSQSVSELHSVDEVASAVTAGKPTIIMFYAPWCPHCQATEPVFDRVAQNVSDIKFAQIDASGIAEVRGPHNVVAYPTIKYFDGSGDAASHAVKYDWHGAIEDDLRAFAIAQKPAVAAGSAPAAEVLLATQGAAQGADSYSAKDCDCSWVDESVTSCDGGDDGTICWRACCHATVYVTSPKAPLLQARRSPQTPDDGQTPAGPRSTSPEAGKVGWPAGDANGDGGTLSLPSSDVPEGPPQKPSGMAGSS